MRGLSARAHATFADTHSVAQRAFPLPATLTEESRAGGCPRVHPPLCPLPAPGGPPAQGARGIPAVGGSRACVPRSLPLSGGLGSPRTCRGTAVPPSVFPSGRVHVSLSSTCGPPPPERVGRKPHLTDRSFPWGHLYGAPTGLEDTVPPPPGLSAGSLVSLAARRAGSARGSLGIFPPLRTRSVSPFHPDPSPQCVSPPWRRLSARSSATAPLSPDHVGGLDPYFPVLVRPPTGPLSPSGL